METLEILLEKAVQLCNICSDWNLPEVEIDEEMVSIYDLRDEFKHGIESIGEISNASDPAPVVEFSGESYYVSSEETDVEIICSGSVGYSLYDRSVMGCIDVPGNYTIKIYKTEDLK